MNEKRFELSEYSTVYRYSVIDNIQKGTLKANEIIILLSKQAEKIDEQQSTINELKERNAHNFAKKIELMKENEQLKNELRKEKSLREYSDSMYGADLIVNIRFSNGEWKADVSVIDDE